MQLISQKPITAPGNDGHFILCIFLFLLAHPFLWSHVGWVGEIEALEAVWQSTSSVKNKRDNEFLQVHRISAG